MKLRWLALYRCAPVHGRQNSGRQGGSKIVEGNENL